ncbi:MAG: UDP-glucose 6-dehydrogenase, partial [Dehalococcoidia bacterium]
MKISVVGVGYVGLVSAAGLAHVGHSVVCIDTDNERVDLVNQGISPLCEA